MTRIRTFIAVLAIAVPVPAVVAGCGGGSSSNEDPNKVLDETFNNPTKITSGHLNVSFNGSAEGSQSGSASVTVDGPFQGDANNPTTTFPQFDLSASVDASGAGQSFSFDGSLAATKDNAYVTYKDQAYEVGSTVFQQFKQSYEQQASQAQAQGGQNASSILKQFGVDPKSWLTNLSNEGTEDVEGTSSIHIHGDANVDQIVADFQKIAQQAGGTATQQISPAQLDQVKSAIKDASVDLYSGQDDHLLRKLALTLTVAPPASAGAPVSSVKIDFSLTLSDVNQPQTITAPSSAKPISELLQQLGISGLPLGALGGASGGGVSGGGVPSPGSPGFGKTGGKSGSLPPSALPGGGGGPAQAYAKCLQQAKTPNDFNKCAQKLQ